MYRRIFTSLDLRRAPMRMAIGAAVVLAGALAAPVAAADELHMGGMGAALGLLERLGEAHAAAGGDRARILPSLGSGGGIAAVRDGTIQVAISGRPLSAAEQAAGLRELRLLRTPLILISSRQPPPGLTRAGLPSLYANAAATWPDGAPLRLILRAPSETAVRILADDVPGLADAIAAARTRRYIPVAATDQDNFQLARSTPGSLSLALLLQLRTEGEDLAAVPLDGVAPSLEALEAGRYRLSMELSIVVSARPTPATARFLAFLRAPAARAIMRDAGAAGFELPAEP